MKLLLDQNIGKKIIENLQDIYPESKHATELPKGQDSDFEFWNFALANELVLVTTDADFLNLSIIAHKSPKTIHIHGEVITTTKMEWILRINQQSIQEFVDNPQTDCLTIQA